jgi:hypothetical protein
MFFTRAIRITGLAAAFAVLGASVTSPAQAADVGVRVRGTVISLSPTP